MVAEYTSLPQKKKRTSFGYVEPEILTFLYREVKTYFTAFTSRRSTNGLNTVFQTVVANYLFAGSPPLALMTADHPSINICLSTLDSCSVQYFNARLGQGCMTKLVSPKV